MHDVMEIFNRWGPMLLLIGVWIYFMLTRSGPSVSQRDYMTSQQASMAELTAETKRHHAELERLLAAIVDKLDDRRRGAPTWPRSGGPARS